eukprot:CAMPEP_0184355744 /NCGR_PEP_ID=MMETSP1089-20130417/98114_1 /TAXON_ID=38269 ORGANISM="Gloeochaete wittrockiana, Strain SAG46.84" /NCGR_SAMPLE_ID=MMETSP1089 /ASSEMBLY_ACC=CAM_ASM_000445 /LENGTH=118 /DNA_ID=CAMNT_0026692581 /DNA_START=67 /DNA_END=423 /DNA_ORIENTATION=+
MPRDSKSFYSVSLEKSKESIDITQKIWQERESCSEIYRQINELKAVKNEINRDRLTQREAINRRNLELQDVANESLKELRKFKEAVSQQLQAKKAHNLQIQQRTEEINERIRKLEPSS